MLLKARRSGNVKCEESNGSGVRALAIAGSRTPRRGSKASPDAPDFVPRGVTLAYRYARTKRSASRGRRDPLPSGGLWTTLSPANFVRPSPPTSADSAFATLKWAVRVRHLHTSVWIRAPFGQGAGRCRAASRLAATRLMLQLAIRRIHMGHDQRSAFTSANTKVGG